MGSLSKLLRASFGVRTTSKSQPLVVQVETSVTRIVQENPNRVGLIIVNTGSNTIYVGLTNAVSLTAGINIFPGGAITFNWNDDMESVANERYAIASALASTCYIEEIVITPDSNEEP